MSTSNATPPIVARNRNQEKNDVMSAAAALALTGLQSVPTSSDGISTSSNDTPAGKTTEMTDKKDDAPALEISQTFPQIVSRLFVMRALELHSRPQRTQASLFYDHQREA